MLLVKISIWVYHTPGHRENNIPTSHGNCIFRVKLKSFSSSYPKTGYSPMSTYANGTSLVPLNVCYVSSTINEDVDHLFLWCSYARWIWNDTLPTNITPPMIIFTLQQLLHMTVNQRIFQSWKLHRVGHSEGT
jgi:hypothetical protein